MSASLNQTVSVLWDSSSGEMEGEWRSYTIYIVSIIWGFMYVRLFSYDIVSVWYGEGGKHWDFPLPFFPHPQMKGMD